MNIVIPMAGRGSKFMQQGIEKPKPFIDVNGKPMFVRVMENLDFPGARFILIAQEEHLQEESYLIKEIEKEYNATFIPIDRVTEGTACTALFAREEINNNIPLIIANSDQIVDLDISIFINDCLNRKVDGHILCFKDKELNPHYSFAKINKAGYVIQVKEKEVISDLATVGIYYFSKGRYFVDGAIDMIINNDRVNNEFYTCPVYNYLVAQDLKIGTFNIEFEKMHCLGNPAALKEYKNKINANLIHPHK
ncbi:MAG: glycosyltransferase family 2 protein [Bacteroidota bacterium]